MIRRGRFCNYDSGNVHGFKQTVFFYLNANIDFFIRFELLKYMHEIVCWFWFFDSYKRCHWPQLDTFKYNKNTSNNMLSSCTPDSTFAKKNAYIEQKTRCKMERRPYFWLVFYKIHIYWESNILFKQGVPDIIYGRSHMHTGMWMGMSATVCSRLFFLARSPAFRLAKRLHAVV